jgi:hypothetical protein
VAVRPWNGHIYKNNMKLRLDSKYMESCKGKRENGALDG